MSQESLPESVERFDVMIEQIQKLVQALESGELPLEDSIQHYEKGLELIHKCQHVLKKSKQRIDDLQQKYGLETEPLENQEES